MSKPPLWEVMQGAYFEGRNPGFSDRHGYAAEIRALRDWLVPEESMPSDELSSWDRLWERQRLRALLTAEAERAERGEVEP